MSEFYTRMTKCNCEMCNEKQPPMVTRATAERTLKEHRGTLEERLELIEIFPELKHLKPVIVRCHECEWEGEKWECIKASPDMEEWQYKDLGCPFCRENEKWSVVHEVEDLEVIDTKGLDESIEKLKRMKEGLK